MFQLFRLLSLTQNYLLILFVLCFTSISAVSFPADTIHAYPWCEGFSSNLFPPSGWTITGGAASYWLRDASVSGYDLGVGSAYYNCWDAFTGENEHFRTFTFQPTFNLLDSLEFDYSYAPYPWYPPYAQDSLIILASTDGGVTWISLIRMGPLQLMTYNEGYPRLWAIKRLLLPLGANKIDFFGKSGYGNDIYIDSICIKHPVGIQPVSHKIPSYFSLSQNYPNPFNPSTTITYSIPLSGTVILTVYDVSGSVVKILVDKIEQPGSYDIKFDGSDYSSGIYFYKLVVGNFSETKKMLLVK